MSAKNTGKIVKFTLNAKSPAKFSKEERRRLLAKSDADIDFSDVPGRARVLEAQSVRARRVR